MSGGRAPATGAWVAAILASAAIAILARVLSADALYWVFKPLATILIAALAFQRGRGRYARAIFTGLLLSLAGDVLLIPPGLFVAGLAAFLAAHVAYLFAFTRDAPPGARLRPFAAVSAIALGILAVLWPRLPAGLGLPVLAYVAMLGAMTAQAFARHAVLGDPGSRRAAIGGALFLASDALLAIDRFHTALPLDALLVLGTYYPAQLLIALSIPPDSPGPLRAGGPVDAPLPPDAAR